MLRGLALSSSVRVTVPRVAVPVEVGVEEGDGAGGWGRGGESGGELAGAVGDDGGGGEGEGSGRGEAEAGDGLDGGCGPGAAVSWRMRWLPVSARVTRVVGEMAVARGVSSEAAVAGPLSPAKAWVPSPAMVVMMPVVASMRRMRWLAVSAR